MKYPFILLIAIVFTSCGKNNQFRRNGFYNTPYATGGFGGYGRHGCFPPRGMGHGSYAYCQWLMSPGSIQCHQHERQMQLQRFCQQYIGQFHHTRVAHPRLCVRGWGPFAVWWHGMACNSRSSNGKASKASKRAKKARDKKEGTSKRAERRRDREEKQANRKRSESDGVVLDMNKCRKIMPSRNPVTDKMDKYFRDEEDAREHARNYNVECFEKGVGWTPLLEKPEQQATKVVTKQSPVQQSKIKSDPVGTAAKKPSQEVGETVSKVDETTDVSETGTLPKTLTPDSVVKVDEATEPSDVPIKVEEGTADVSECFSLKDIHDYVLTNDQSIASYSRLYGFDILDDDGQSVMDQTSREMKMKMFERLRRSSISRFSFSNPSGDIRTAIGTKVTQSSGSDEVHIDKYEGKVIACDLGRHMTIKNFDGNKCADGESYSGEPCEFREYAWNGFGLHLNEAEKEDQNGEINLVRKGLFVDKETGESVWYRAWHHIYWMKVDDPSQSRDDVLKSIQTKSMEASGFTDAKYREHSQRWQQFLRDTSPLPRSVEDILKEQESRKQQ